MKKKIKIIKASIKISKRESKKIIFFLKKRFGIKGDIILVFDRKKNEKNKR